MADVTCSHLEAIQPSNVLSAGVRGVCEDQRSQTVVSTGPYQYVRHPMYAGFVVFTLGTAFLLGSWYGLLGGLLLIGMVAWPTVQEERVLLEELDCYGVYMKRVRSRLIPRVW